MPPIGRSHQLPLGVGRWAPGRPHVLGVPAEHGLVEGLRRVEVRRDELAPAVGPGLVGHLRARVLVGLPDADHRTEGVGEHGHAAGVHDVHRRHEHGPAVGRHLGHGVVGAVDVHIGHPGRSERRGSSAGRSRPRSCRPGRTPSTHPPRAALRGNSTRTAPRRTPSTWPGRCSTGPPTKGLRRRNVRTPRHLLLRPMPRPLRRYPIVVPRAAAPR